jgi:hypothetical protein
MRNVLLGLMVTAPVFAGEEAITLKEGPGRDKVVSYCAMCHSLDYIQINAAILDKAGWEKSVNKMVNVMGAPIPDEDVPVIVEYLTKVYGK